jgi:ribose transport system ATP-binding protein
MDGQSLVLEARNISKHYGAVEALKNVTFASSSHSIHAIVGENGAGKSTLMKIIAGVAQPSAGDIVLRGTPLRLFSPVDALRSSIVSVFQELSIIPDLTVAENISISLQRPQKGAFSSLKQQCARAEEILARMKCEDIDPRGLCSNLSLSRLQLVEIAKALSNRPTVLILDEATSALTASDAEKVFGLLKVLRTEGVSMLYITHHLREVDLIADTCSVFRNGERVATFPQGTQSQEEIVTMMLGRPLSKVFPVKNPAAGSRGTVVLDVSSLQWYDRLRDISFKVGAGEIVGIGGIDGQGQKDLLYALFGVLKNVRGEVRLDGRKVSLKSPWAIVRAGGNLVMIPEDRKSEGLFLSMSILKNISFAALRKLSRGLFINAASETNAVNEMIGRMQIRVGSIHNAIDSLSGGNQQKVVIAKWLLLQSHCILLMDPTRGIDVGTKQEIYSLLRNMADQGTAILLYSTDYNELVGLCDRVLIMYKGQVVNTLVGDDITDKNILVSSLNLNAAHPEAPVEDTHEQK